MISVVVPVKNGGDGVRRCLQAITAQAVEEEVEVIVVDSGSTDGSVAVARELATAVHEIPPGAFSHGATRNLGAGLSSGDVLVFTSQDAYALDERWLAALVGPLRASDAVAGVYGRQLPHADALPPERYFLDFLYGPEPREQRATGAAELSVETTLFSNANAAIRRSVWERFPFAEDLVMSEDQEWATRVLLAGHAIRYEPGAVVRHSHRYTVGSAFRRFFDSGASAERAYLAGGRSARSALRRRAIRYALGELSWLWRTRQRRWIPYAAVYELAKLAGLQLGARHRLLPLWLKLRLSALPDFWTREGRPARPVG